MGTSQNSSRLAGLQLPSGSYYGTSLRSTVVSGFKLSETVYSGEIKTPNHSHELAYLGIVLEGEAYQTVGSRSHSCRQGTSTFHPPGETHRDHFVGPSVRLLQIELLPARLAEISEHAAHLIPRRIDGDSGRQSWLANRVRWELHESDELSPLAIEGLVLELFIEIWRRAGRSLPTRPPEWLKRANALIQERFTEKLAVNTISGEVGVHASHLSREFRRFYRKTIGDRVRELRVEFARHELSCSYRPLADIAAEAGFCDQAHLSRTFRRLTGVTPESFRAAALPRKSGSTRA